MRVVLCFIVTCLISLKISNTQSKLELGPMNLHATIGTLPTKYVRLSANDQRITNAITEILPWAVKKMVPSVFTIHNIGPVPIDLSSFSLTGNLIMKRIEVIGLNELTLQALQIRKENNRIDFKLHVPKVSSDVHFDFDGKMGAVPIDLSGTVNLSVDDLKPSGALSIRKLRVRSAGEVYKIESGDLNLELQKIILNVKNVAAAALEQDVEILKELLKSDTKNKIAHIIFNAIIEQVNEKLLKIPAIKIDALLS